MRIDRDFLVVMERLGPVLVDALLSIPPADDDVRLGPVLVDALLSIPPACDDERLGPVLVGCFALDTASEVVMRHWGRY